MKPRNTEEKELLATDSGSASMRPGHEAPEYLPPGTIARPPTGSFNEAGA